MNIFQTAFSFFCVVFLFFFASCSGVSGPGGSQSNNTGVTSCGDFSQCQAGQYCSDETFGKCSNGCLSDNNCASNQSCAKEAGENVGTCQAKEPVTTHPNTTVDNNQSSTKACVAACKKVTSCKAWPSDSNENQCVASCKNASVVDSTGGFAKVLKLFSDCVDNATCTTMSQCFSGDVSFDSEGGSVETNPGPTCSEKCTFDSHCTSGNCTQGCCRENTKGSPCSFDAHCNSGNCTQGTCQ